MNKFDKVCEEFKKSCSHWTFTPEGTEAYNTVIEGLLFAAGRAPLSKSEPAKRYEPSPYVLKAAEPPGTIFIEDRVLLTVEEQKQGWKAWDPQHDSYCPVPYNTLTYLKMKSGREDTTHHPETWNWTDNRSVDWIVAYKTTAPVKKTGWIDHHGNADNRKCPIEKYTPIDIELRDGTIYKWEGDRSKVKEYAYEFSTGDWELLWKHMAGGRGYQGHGSDIIAYRLVKSASEIVKEMKETIKDTWLINDGKDNKCPVPTGKKFRIIWGSGTDDPMIYTAPRWNWKHTGKPVAGDISKYMILEDKPVVDAEAWIPVDLSRFRPRADGSKYHETGTVYTIPPEFNDDDPIEVKFEDGNTKTQDRVTFYIWEPQFFKRPQGKITHYRKGKRS